MRDFVVGVRVSTYNIETHKFTSKFDNINVLVGPRADIDKIKTEINKFTEGFTFVKQWREKAIDE
jgi:hypothetical protein